MRGCCKPVGFYRESISLLRSLSVLVFSWPDLVPAVYSVGDVLRREMTPLSQSLSLSLSLSGSCLSVRLPAAGSDASN